MVFPRRSKKPKAGDSPAEQLQTVRTPIIIQLARLNHSEQSWKTAGGWVPASTPLQSSSGLLAQWTLHPQPAWAQPDCSCLQVAQHTGVLLPAKRAAPEVETVAVTDEMKVTLLWRRCSATPHRFRCLSGFRASVVQ